MSKKAFSLFLFSALLGLAFSLPVIAHAAINLHEGKWETVMQMKMEGMSFAIPPTTMRQCIGADDAVPKPDEQSKCTIKKQSVSGNTVTWQQECIDSRGSKSEIAGEVVYSGDSSKGTVRIKTADRGQTMVMTGTMTGRRIGDCTDKGKMSLVKDGKEVDVDQYQAENQQRAKEIQGAQANREKADQARTAAFNAIVAPEEASGACTLSDPGFKDSDACKRKVGELRMKPGQWRILLEGKQKLLLGAQDMITDNEPQTETVCLTFDSMVPPISEMETGDVSLKEKKRSTDRITWKYRQVAGPGQIDEQQGGIIYKGDTLAGAFVKKTNTAGQRMETRIKITGARVGDGECLEQERDYTSQDRSTSGAGATLNKLKGLLGR